MKTLRLVFLLAWLLTACKSSSLSPTAAPGSATQTLAGPRTLAVMTHDSFAVSEDVVQEFESTHNVTVQFLKSGDAGEARAKNKSFDLVDALCERVHEVQQNTSVPFHATANVTEEHERARLDFRRSGWDFERLTGETKIATQGTSRVNLLAFARTKAACVADTERPGKLLH